jgi:hypothetical protein
MVSNGLSREVSRIFLMGVTPDLKEVVVQDSLSSGSITNFKTSVPSVAGISYTPIVSYRVQSGRVALFRERIRAWLGFRSSLVLETRAVAGEQAIPLEAHLPLADPRIDPKTEEDFLDTQL